MRIWSRRYLASLSTGISKPYNVLFFGSNEYSRITLDTLYTHKNFPKVISRLAVIAPAVVATNTPGDFFQRYLINKQIEQYTFQHQITQIEEIMAQQQTPFDLAIIASFNKVIPDNILVSFGKGVLVAHPSLLPKYRGIAPIEHCILNEDKETGVTILEASKQGILLGKILKQNKFNVDSNDDYIQLARKCGRMAGEILIEILNKLDEYELYAKEQKVSKDDKDAPPFTSAETVFLWDKLTTKEAVKKQKALFGSPMSGFTKLKIRGKWSYAFFNELIPIPSTSDTYKKLLEPLEDQAKPGVIHWDLNDYSKIYIRCSDGWVSANRIEINNKCNTIPMFITEVLNEENFNENNSFAHKFATSKNLIKVKQY